MTSDRSVTLGPCHFDAHAAAILDIFNDAIQNSTALYEYRPRTMQTMQAWFDAKHTGNHPVVGAFAADGQLLGFASWGPFRAFPAFKYTAEHSIYVRADQRGRGLGETLLRELLRLAEERGLHVLVGGIDMANRGSIALHEKLGFVHTGTLPQVGFKFGRWLDLGFWQKQLPTPAEPVDG
ncbi:GNAT family N-acetyltransferase [Sphaerotilus microaerophilus]|uniref:N-acetyltransferase n=1 Tax=Sphaerotilus microaerophilus TaxID=2914710 RepID=A0ABN6PTZ0_9BURK|nr:GNAT family N-acetyltransferase [Sphaerotilus sp. FB-5]BDI08108.1 N-acetyltransferase [Sphaerotilus sp. FB-5]